MDEKESLNLAIKEQVKIVSYDPLWPDQYESEKKRLLSLFPDSFLAIEHIGSTAVPGLAAKPIIDLVAAVTSMEIADTLLPSLCAKGYTTSAEFNLTLKDRRWLMRHFAGRRTHHLHLVLMNAEDWLNKLRFRDLLRSDTFVAGEYLKLKKSLAESVGSDREAYSEAKTDFINKVLEQKK